MRTLYIIHGWAYSVERWSTTIQLLEKQGIKVKMLNVPGLTSLSDKVWTISDYAKWADENIPDGAIALGHSNGGRILLNLLAKNPKKLSGLILLDSAGIYEPSRKRDIIKKLAKLGAPLKKIPLIDKAFHRLTGSTDYSHAPANMKRTLENMLESDKRLSLNNINTKTIILWGEADTITPLRQGKTLHSALKNSTFKTFPDWPHSPYIDHSEELANTIKSAYEELS